MAEKGSDFRMPRRTALDMNESAVKVAFIGSADDFERFSGKVALR